MATIRKKPEGPPNRWCKSLYDRYPYDVITGHQSADREIARQKGLHPQPVWWRLFQWWSHVNYTPFKEGAQDA